VKVWLIVEAGMKSCQGKVGSFLPTNYANEPSSCALLIKALQLGKQNVYLLEMNKIAQLIKTGKTVFSTPFDIVI